MIEPTPTSTEKRAGLALRPKADRPLEHVGSWWRRLWFSITPQVLVGVFTVASLSFSLLFTLQLALRSQNQLTESTRGRLHTLRVEESSQSLLAAVAGAEADLRDYISSRAETDFQLMREKRAAAIEALEVLRSLVADDPAGQTIATRLDSLLETRFGLMDRLVENARPGSDANLLALMLADRGYECGNALRAETASLLSRVRRDDSIRQEVLGGKTGSALGWLSAFVVLNALCVAGVVTVVFRAGRMSRIATVCAWSHTIEYEGRWMSFEQYLEARFGIRASHGISPEEAAKMMATLPRPGR